jgi:hypothetical protein
MGESLSDRKKERKKVKDYIKKYFKGKAPKLKKIREHEKVMLGGG